MLVHKPFYVWHGDGDGGVNEAGGEDGTIVLISKVLSFHLNWDERVDDG